jgi:hypothetical protein
VARFEQTVEGARVIQAWEWLVWAYRIAIPKDIDHLRVLARRDIRG